MQFSLSALFDELPEAVVFFEPIYAGDVVIDFSIGYANDSAAAMAGGKGKDMPGMRLSTIPLQEESLRADTHAHCMKVLLSKTVVERNHEMPRLGVYLFSVKSPLGTGILSRSILRSRDSIAAEEQQRNARIAELLTEGTLNGLFLMRPVRNDADGVTDFEMLRVNAPAEAMLNQARVDLEGKAYLSIFPTATDFFALYKRSIETETIGRGVMPYGDANFSGVYEVAAIPLGRELLLVTFTDVLPTQRMQHRLDITEQKLRTVFDATPSGIFALSPVIDESDDIVDFRYVIANQAIAAYAGQTPEALEGKLASQWFPNYLTNGFFEFYKASYLSGKPQRKEVQYQGDGFDNYIELHCVRIDSELLVSFNDYTELKTLQLQLAESSHRLRAIFDAAQVGMFTLRPERNEGGETVDFRFVIANRNFCAYVGQTPDVLEGALGSTWFPGYLTNGVFDMYRETYLTGEVRRKEVHYEVDGHNLYLDLSSLKMRDEVLVTFADFTELKNLQNTLQHKVSELEDSNKNLQAFAYAASHDLKEPIRKVRFFADRLQGLLGPGLSPEAAHAFDRMIVASERMQLLVDDLLAYSHVSLEMGEAEAVDLNEKVQRVLSDLELLVSEKGAAVQVDALPVVRGSRRQLQQLFTNLLSNALKYNRPGVKPNIQVRATAAPTREGLPPSLAPGLYHRIEVEDNGIGFEPEAAEKIFQVFYRLHGNAEYKGSGVGLAIAKKVVENHRGAIEASGKPGEGATFRVWLPAE